MRLVVESYTDGGLVLVAVDAPQFVWFPVQAETFPAVEAKPSESGFVRNTVQFFAGFGVTQYGDNFVEPRFFGTPQLRTVYSGGFLDGFGLSRVDGEPLFQRLLQPALRVVYQVHGFEVGFLCRIVCDFAAHFEGCCFFVYMRRTDEYSVRTVVEEIEVLFGRSDEPYVAIDASPEREVGRDGSDVFPAVVYGDVYAVLWSDVRGHVKCESAVSSVVTADVVPVEADFRRFACRVYFQEAAFALRQFRPCEFFPVGSLSHVVVHGCIGILIIEIGRAHV